MSWWTCHRGRLCPSAAVGGAISRYLTRICVHIRHMHINEIVITFIIVVIIRTMMMIMMIIANLWIIMNMYLYVCVYIWVCMCVFYMCMCAIMVFYTYTHAHLSIRPCIHPQAESASSNAFDAFVEVCSRCQRSGISDIVATWTAPNEWVGICWDPPELSPAKMMPFFGGMILIRGCVEIIWVKVNEFFMTGDLTCWLADPKGMDMSLSKDFLDGSWTNGH